MFLICRSSVWRLRRMICGLCKTNRFDELHYSKVTGPRALIVVGTFNICVHGFQVLCTRPVPYWHAVLFTNCSSGQLIYLQQWTVKMQKYRCYVPCFTFKNIPTFCTNGNRMWRHIITFCYVKNVNMPQKKIHPLKLACMCVHTS